MDEEAEGSPEFESEVILTQVADDIGSSPPTPSISMDESQSDHGKFRCSQSLQIQSQSILQS